MKPINFKIKDVVSVGFIDSATDREELYGKKTVVVRPGAPGTKTGETLERAALRGNGECVRKREIKSISIDPKGSLSETAKIVIGSTSNEAVKIPATTEMELTPVPFSKIHEFTTLKFSGILLGNVEPGLYETSYNGRATTSKKTCLLMVKEKITDEKDLIKRNEENKPNAFLLQGQLRLSTWVGHQSDQGFFDAEEETAESDDPLSVNF